jgi:predicted RNA-binding Zn-ribbon protein involved in translation (DUF1610 family)
MNHTLVRYENGGDGWTEFECGRCGVDIDMFDFDQVEVCTAAKSDTAFRCPNCYAEAVPIDKTNPE